MGPSGSFYPVVKLDTLMGESCVGKTAAFSENLNVYHMTFDGWSRLRSLDASKVKAFTLAPKPSTDS